ncbi:hypothetical protein, partial [Brevibacillus aydinogluensis]|uniref:hypothetical protein n=1 Tax=Brevibacillus aydinogluensis TaxID=927786 RepID=UPI0028935265
PATQISTRAPGCGQLLLIDRRQALPRRGILVRAGSRLPAKQLSTRAPGCGQLLQFIDERRALPGRDMPAWSGAVGQRRCSPPVTLAEASCCSSSIAFKQITRPRVPGEELVAVH